MAKTIDNDLKCSTIYVNGMHCSSCELLIEKKLLKHEGVESVDVSRADSSVTVYHKKGALPSNDKLNTEFASLGYSFVNKKPEPARPLFQFHNGNLKVNREKLQQLKSAILIAITFLAVFFVIERLQIGQYISVSATSSLPAFFLLGIVAGASSCAALIGGLLLSMSKQWHEAYIDSDQQSEKTKPHILFHTGRLLAFALFGGVLGLIGETISLNNATAYAVIVIAVSIGMLMLALQMLEVEWAERFSLRLPKGISRFAANESNFSGKYMPFAVGAFTFFLPCGFTLIAQSVALTTGNFLQGAAIMLFFALGTLPVLAGISFSGVKFNAEPHLSAKFNKVAGLLIVFFVLYNINGQLNVLGLPSLNDISLPVAEERTVSPPVIAGDQQVVALTAQGFSYKPTGSTTFAAGVPTLLTVENKGIQGCGAFLSASGLLGSFVELKPGTNTFAIGTPKPGKYKITCSMGMVPPVTITFN